MKELFLIYIPPIIGIIIWMIAVKVCEIIKIIKEEKENAKENKQLDVWEHF